MGKIKIESDGGKIYIKLRDKARTSAPTRPGPPFPSGMVATPVSPDATILILTPQLIELMEIRAESAFRPNDDDVEIVYALSGAVPTQPDMIHKLSSRAVVEEASENHIISSMDGMMEHIQRERDDEPKLIIELHTHPSGVASPSDADKKFFQGASQRIRQQIPGVRVLFGIHAVSDEAIRERGEPSKISKNGIRWSSITRDHEVAFFDPSSKPWEVMISG